MRVCSAAGGDVDERGDTAPVAHALGHEVEVRRAPVFHESGFAVRPCAAVELLHVGAAATARRDREAFLALLRLQPHDVPGLGGPAVHAATVRDGPGAPAEVTGHTTTAVLQDVAEPGGSATERTRARA